MLIPSGKHKGKRLDQLRGGQVAYLHATWDVNDPFYQLICDEMDANGYEQMNVTLPKPKPGPVERPRIDYRAYMQSAKWMAKSRKKRRLVPYCEICGSKENLQCHHRNYKHLGQERMKDLKVLCRSCHMNAHEESGYESDTMKTYLSTMENILGG